MRKLSACVHWEGSIGDAVTGSGRTGIVEREKRRTDTFGGLAWNVPWHKRGEEWHKGGKE